MLAPCRRCRFHGSPSSFAGLDPGPVAMVVDASLFACQDTSLDASGDPGPVAMVVNDASLFACQKDTSLNASGDPSPVAMVVDASLFACQDASLDASVDAIV